MCAACSSSSSSTASDAADAGGPDGRSATDGATSQPVDASAVGTKGTLVTSFGTNGLYEAPGGEVRHVAERPAGGFVYCDEQSAWRAPPDGKQAPSADAYLELTVHPHFDSCLGIRAEADGSTSVGGSGGQGSSLGSYLGLFGDHPAYPNELVKKVGGAKVGEANSKMLFASDGRIYVAMAFTNALGAPTVCRYTASGGPTNLYQGDSCAATTTANGAASLSGLAVRPDGTIAIVGAVGAKPALIEVPVTTGIVKPYVGSAELAKLGVEELGVALADATNHILILGRKGAFPNADLVVVRVGRDNLPDASFGSGGVARLGRSDVRQLGQILLGTDGRITVSATIGADEASSHAVVARFDKDGKLDPSFGNGGVAQPLGGTPSTGASLASTKDGNIVLGGSLFKQRLFLVMLTH